jgi:hypothetical protein
MSRTKDSRPPLEDVDLGDLPGRIASIDNEELERRAALASTFESPAFVAKGTEAGHIRLIRTAGAAKVEPNGAGEGASIPDPPSGFAGSATTSAAVVATPPAPEPEEPQRRRRSEEPNFTVRLPEYVQQALRMKAVSERTTVRLILLKLLRNSGYQVDDEDMTDDRGIVAKMRSKARRPD